MISGPDDIRNLAEADRAKNRVYILFDGFLTVEQAKQLKEAYRVAISKVKHGYTVLTYFRKFKPGTPEVQDIVSSMIRMASQAGCRKAARVGGGSVLGQMQLGRLSADNASYPHHNFATWEEAEAYLDSDEKD